MRLYTVPSLRIQLANKAWLIIEPRVFSVKDHPGRSKDRHKYRLFVFAIGYSILECFDEYCNYLLMKLIHRSQYTKSLKRERDKRVGESIL